MTPSLASPWHDGCAADTLVPRAACSPTPGTRPAPSLTTQHPRSQQRSFVGAPADASSPGLQGEFSSRSSVPGSRLGGGGGQRPVPFSGGWGTQKVAWSRGRVALFENYAARQCPPSTVSERRHEGRPSLRSGDGQSGGGQESRRRGSEPCSAGVDKPGEPSGDQKDILLSPPTSPPVATHTGRAPWQGGDEQRGAGGRRGE